jgi:hypothetical protein
MKMEDYYTKDEIDYMCICCGLNPRNINDSIKDMCIEKFEQMILDKINEAEARRS